VSRVQLALNVADLSAAIEFYAKLFDTQPSKLMPGYANFAIDEPPLKLVLIEGEGPGAVGRNGKLNHLGIEVSATNEVEAASSRFATAGLETRFQARTTCCYAVQDKVWVTDPDGASWEVYSVLADASAETGLSGDGTCCSTSVEGDACC
jgi:catechol 2,3-dioxygenase-like lactoylglutathione lyase family enzyme